MPSIGYARTSTSSGASIDGRLPRYRISKSKSDLRCPRSRTADPITITETTLGIDGSDFIKEVSQLSELPAQRRTTQSSDISAVLVPDLVMLCTYELLYLVIVC